MCRIVPVYFESEKRLMKLNYSNIFFANCCAMMLKLLVRYCNVRSANAWSERDRNSEKNATTNTLLGLHGQ